MSRVWWCGHPGAWRRGTERRCGTGGHLLHQHTSLKPLFLTLDGFFWFFSTHEPIWTRPSLVIVAGRSLEELVRGLRYILNLRYCSTSECALFGCFKLFTEIIYCNLARKTWFSRLMIWISHRPIQMCFWPPPQALRYRRNCCSMSANDRGGNLWQSSPKKVQSHPQRFQATSQTQLNLLAQRATMTRRPIKCTEYIHHHQWCHQASSPSPYMILSIVI